MEQIHKNEHRFGGRGQAPRVVKSVQVSSSQSKDRISNYHLCIDNRNGMVFSSLTVPISGLAKFHVDEASSYSILIRDKDSSEIARIGLKPKTSGTISDGPFSWDLKSRSGSIVESGHYRISLAELSNGVEIERCSVECLVADAREILATTDLLKTSQRFADPSSKRVLAIYADIIRDIEIRIVEGLEDNQFDEPYFVARTTAGFVRQIYNDIENDSASQFRALIEKFVSKNPGLRLRPNGSGLGLRALFDFLVNYMADPEDQARATAMVKCEYRNFTASDRRIILSALVSGILPHCMTFAPPNNAIGRQISALIERMLKVGIRYVCAKHIDKSISMCRAALGVTTLPTLGMRISDA